MKSTSITINNTNSNNDIKTTRNFKKNKISIINNSQFKELNILKYNKSIKNSIFTQIINNLIIAFFTLMIYAVSYENQFYNNTKFPFDEGNQNNGGGDGNSSKICLTSAIGNGMCDEQNNNDFCNFDGGDCCAASCISNCEKKNKTENPCNYACGNTGYNCITGDECESCSNHGKCVDMSICMKAETDFDPVLLSIDACNINTTTFGNSHTIDAYCGLDPYKNITHISSNPDYHYPGCGYFSVFCTKLPCCDVVVYNSHNSTNCKNEESNMDVYDDSVKSYVTKYENCLDYYYNCFLENQQYRGQCCECFEGWGGRNCTIPLCKEACVHGYCSFKDVCTCYEGYTGDLCQLPICDEDCINGICSYTNTCECFYGWEGSDCTTPIKFPFCVNGYPTDVDVCACNSGWEGDLCEIKTCTNCENGICNDDGSCVCNFGYVSSEPDNYKICDEYVSCEIIIENCNKCKPDASVCYSCSFGFYLFVDTDGVQYCKSCREYNERCLECTSLECTLCEYPLQIIDQTCDSYGVFEIDSKYYYALEDSYFITININRFFGTKGNVYVSYEVIPEYVNKENLVDSINNNLFNYYPNIDYTNNPLNIADLVKGVAKFQAGETIISFNIRIYPDYGVSNYGKIFKIQLKMAFNGAFISNDNTSYLEIFDVADKFPGINHIVISILQIEKFNKQTYLFINKLEIFIENYNYLGVSRSTVIDLFISKWFNSQGILIIYRIPYLINNTYSLELSNTNFEKGYYQVQLETCSKGITIEHYNTADFTSIPFFRRISYSVSVGDYYSNLSYFSRRIIMNIKNPDISVVNILKIHFYLPYKDLSKLYDNRVLVFFIDGEIIQHAYCGRLGSCFKGYYEIHYNDGEFMREIIFEHIHLEGLVDLNISFITDYDPQEIPIEQFTYCYTCEFIPSKKEFMVEVYK